MELFPAHTEVGFMVPKGKRKRKYELARWRYKIKLDIEETAEEAEKLGFKTRLLEGQPKNKRGTDGWGEAYPLNQYEISGGQLPVSIKIQVSPLTTQRALALSPLFWSRAPANPFTIEPTAP
jgi:hypothetical protein